MSWNRKFPWGLHGYHRSSAGGGQAKVFGSKSSLDTGDPFNLYPNTREGNAMRRLQQGDPFGLFYKPPDRPLTEEELAQQEEARKQGVRTQIDQMYGIGNDTAKAALDKEGATVGDATRSYYTDALNRAFAKAERNTRFNLARAGQLGSSEFASQQGEVASDRDLGATRIDEAVRKAVASLQTQREGERLNAIGLVNAGVGDQAIDAAGSGLRTSLSNASNQNKADIFGDLFANSADAMSSQNANSANAALLARYKQQLGTTFPTSGGGTVTATS